MLGLSLFDSPSFHLSLLETYTFSASNTRNFKIACLRVAIPAAHSSSGINDCRDHLLFSDRSALSVLPDTDSTRATIKEFFLFLSATESAEGPPTRTKYKSVERVRFSTGGGPICSGNFVLSNNCHRRNVITVSLHN